MKIAILGAGNIGGTLGKKWAQAGHQVRFGVRNVGNPDPQILAQAIGATVTTTAEAIAFGEVVVFAIPGAAMEETIIANAAALDDKIVIDTANNVRAAVMNSLGSFAQHTPRAAAYRAFNTLGWENFDNPQLNGTPIDLFFCGSDGATRAVVETLIADIGLRPIYIGGPDQAGVVDNLTRLWFALAIGRGMGRRIAFSLVSERG